MTTTDQRLENEIKTILYHGDHTAEEVQQEIGTDISLETVRNVLRVLMVVDGSVGFYGGGYYLIGS